MTTSVIITSPTGGELTAPLASISGTAPANSPVTLAFDESPISLTADARGVWTLPVTSQPSPGEHHLRATTPDGGNANVTFVARASYSVAETGGGMSIPWWVWAGGAAVVIWWAATRASKSSVQQIHSSARG